MYLLSWKLIIAKIKNFMCIISTAPMTEQSKNNESM